MDNNLGNIISELRSKKGLTQKELADKLGISDKAVSRWETGKSFPDLDMLFRISKFFKVSFNDLLTARMEDDGTDDELKYDIIKEFNAINKKHSRTIKWILLGTLLLAVLFIIVIIFTNTYNRFKVYQVGIESSEFEGINGIYVETNIKDTLTLNNLKIKDLKVKETDTISVDLYYIENNKEHVIQNYTTLENIVFTNFQSYIKINDLSKYMDNLYLRITIIDSKNKISEYEGKLEFTLDFSNNKIFIKDDYENIDNNYDNITVEEIKKILTSNNFEIITDSLLIKKTDDYKIDYITKSNKIIYTLENNNLKYIYTFNLNTSLLEVVIHDENNTEIENYEYNAKTKKVIKCITGSCNNYEEVMNTLNKNILHLLKK